MTVEMSNRHWMVFRHPLADFEFRVRFAKAEDGTIMLEVDRRDATTGEMGRWELVAQHYGNVR
jgi:hypothetical protein